MALCILQNFLEFLHLVGKTYHGLNVRSGIGIQVKKTVTRRKDLRPQTSDKAPINGAQRKDKIPCKIHFTVNVD